MTEEEAQRLINRFLDEPDEARKVFLEAVMTRRQEKEFLELQDPGMIPIRGIIDALIRSNSIRDTEENRRKVAQKVFGIICYYLESPHREIWPESFLKDVKRCIDAFYKDWLTEEEGRAIIQEVKENKYKRFEALIEKACKSRLNDILGIYDPVRISDMTSFVRDNYLKDDCEPLRKLKSPGALKKSIKTTVYRSFLKWKEAHITEDFPNPKKKTCGYAHLRIRNIRENELKRYFNDDWYVDYIQGTFRESVERYYKPYGDKPGYKDIAQYNRSIENELNALFLNLKKEYTISGAFPAGAPSVSYDKTWGSYFDIVDCYSDGWHIISNKGLVGPELEGEDFPSEKTKKCDDIDNSIIVKLFLNRLINNGWSLDKNQWMLDLLIKRKLVERDEVDRESSKDIGYEFYKRGLIEEIQLHGLDPDSEAGQKRLGDIVNKLAQQSYENFRRAIEGFNYNECLVILEYLKNLERDN